MGWWVRRAAVDCRLVLRICLVHQTVPQLGFLAIAMCPCIFSPPELEESFDCYCPTPAHATLQTKGCPLSMPTRLSPPPSTQPPSHPATHAATRYAFTQPPHPHSATPPTPTHLLAAELLQQRCIQRQLPQLLLCFGGSQQRDLVAVSGGQHHIPAAHMSDICGGTSVAVHLWQYTDCSST